MAHRGEVHIGAVEVGTLDVEEPALGGSPAERDVVGLLRSSAHVVVLQIHHLGYVIIQTVLHAACSQRAVLVLVTGDVGGGADGHRGGNFDAGTDFDSLEHLVHARERVVNECVHRVVVERGALRSVLHVGVEGGDNTLEDAVVPIVAQVHAPHLLALEVGNHVVLDTRRHVGVVAQRSVSAVVAVQGKVVAAVEFVDNTALEGEVHEVVLNALAVGVVQVVTLRIGHVVSVFIL